MSRKRIIGIILIAVSLVLTVIFFTEIQKTVTLSGVGAGSTAAYTPPFAFHGPLVVLAGVAAAVFFLIGLYLVSPGRKR